MPHKYQKNSAWDIGTSIERFERDALPVTVKYRIALDFREKGLCREHVVGINVAGEVECRLGAKV
jgi:hypothetical protein